jgi:hypothetical protein
MIFSLSRNFERSLEALKAQCNVHPTQFPETQVWFEYFFSRLSITHSSILSVLLALDCFVTKLWLTSQQFRKLDQFAPLILTPNPRPAVEYALWVLDESLRKSKLANVGSSGDSLASFVGNLDLKLLTNKLTRTLAMLESRLRQDDPVGECIRWLTRGRDRDFVSFPERVSLAEASLTL